MKLRRSLLWLLPIMVLSGFAIAAVRKPQIVEPGLLTAKSGSVVDGHTHQALDGAYVVARWLEQSRAGSKMEGQCLYRTVVRTDEQGRYSIPALQLALAGSRFDTERSYFWDVHAYAPGYAEVAASGKHHPRAVASEAPGMQALEPVVLAFDGGAPALRIDTLADTLSYFDCQSYARSEANPVAEQIYAEACAAACLPGANGAAAALKRLSGLHMSDAQRCARERHVSK